MVWETGHPQSDRCTEMSVGEIADIVDFPARLTSDHFFRHHEGRPPAEFREERPQD